MQREIDKVVAILGSQARLAKALGVSNNAICKWVSHGCIPPGRALAVYRLVKNKRTPWGEEVQLESLLLEAHKMRKSVET